MSRDLTWRSCCGILTFYCFEIEKMRYALEKIDANKQGFVIVTDEEHKGQGILTDGDVRRAIIKGCTADIPVEEIYTRNAKMVRATDGFDTITELFKTSP